MGKESPTATWDSDSNYYVVNLRDSFAIDFDGRLSLKYLTIIEF